MINAATAIDIYLYVHILSFEPPLVFSGVVASVLGDVVVDGPELKVMISMFNMATSI